MSNRKEFKQFQHRFWQEQVDKEKHNKRLSLHSAIKAGLINQISLEDIYTSQDIHRVLKKDSY